LNAAAAQTLFVIVYFVVVRLIAAISQFIHPTNIIIVVVVSVGDCVL